MFISAIAVVITAFLLPGAQVDGFITALIVALVLSILNGFVKPLLQIITIPITILTLGLFLLVINAVIILLADAFVSGFAVNGFLIALIFSLILSVINYILEGIFD